MPKKLTLVEDLEAYWQDVRVSAVEVSSRKTPLEQMLDQAAVATFDDLKNTLWTDDSGKPLDQELFAKILVKGVRQFMSHWYAIQKKQDLGILIEVILEGQDVPAEEMKGFVRALPRRIINRLLKELGGHATGLHALLSVEVMYRDGDLQEDYTLKYDLNEKLVATLRPRDPRAEGKDVTVMLQDFFTNPDPA